MQQRAISAEALERLLDFGREQQSWGCSKRT